MQDSRFSVVFKCKGVKKLNPMKGRLMYRLKPYTKITVKIAFFIKLLKNCF